MKHTLLPSIVAAMLIFTGCDDTTTTEDDKKNPDNKIEQKAGAKLSAIEVGTVYPLSKFNITLGEVTFPNGFKLPATYGLGSGAYHYPADPENIVYIVTDRGVNIKCADDEKITGMDICEKGKIFPFPSFTPTIIKAELGDETITVKEVIALKDSAGKKISGVSNPLSNFSEIAYNMKGDVLALDPNGLDVEALVKLSDGSFWIAEEYAASIAHVAADGKIIKRLVPAGLEDDLSEATYEVEGSLPAIIAKRHANRGIESIAISPDESTLYFIMQSPLDNDDYAKTNRVRLYAMDIATTTFKEYLYEMDAPSSFVKDNESKTRKAKDVKISEMTALPSGELLVLERISAVTKLYKIDPEIIDRNVALYPSGIPNYEVPADKSADLENNDYDNVLPKTKVFDTESRSESFPNKLEGVAHLGGNKFFVINDNDFGILGDDVVSSVIEIDVDEAPVSKQVPGVVAFFNADGDYNSSVGVGILPDMVTFTHDGSKIIVANEGEPVGDEEKEGHLSDPYGSISIIDVASKAVSSVDFKSITVAPTGSKIASGAEIARDFEPEYVTVSADDTKAWIALQETNAIAEINLEDNTLTKVFGLGFKDFSKVENALDFKKDEIVNIETAPVGVYGMYQPDTITSYNVAGKNYIVTANEGDDRDDFYEEATKASELTHSLGESVGDLRVNPDLGDADGDGVYEELYAYGGRSFSIFDADTGALVYDSGSDFETKVAAQIDNDYFATRPKKGKWYTTDERSEKKSIEPESLTLGMIDGKTFAYIGLEKQGGFMVYDITSPEAVSFVEYNNDINYSKEFDYKTEVPADIDDMGPEGSTTFSQDGKNYLALANEVSGTTSVYELANDGRATKMGTYRTGIYYESASEIVVYENSKLYVTNASTNVVMILDVSNVSNITKIKDIDLSPYGDTVNSVAIKNGVVAVAIANQE